MLEKFRQAKIEEIRALKAGAPLSPLTIKRPDFRQALANSPDIAIIAEYKRASPTLGIIRQDLEVEDIACMYAEAGACALSILTEATYFDGKSEYLERAHKTLSGKIPLLRKDFIFDPVQILATAATPAAAVLLIARITPSSAELRQMVEYAHFFGLAAVVEIFDEIDLHKARDAGAQIIQVNARDLQTLKVDRANALRLISHHPPLSNEIWIQASGIENSEHIKNAKNSGYKAALVGSFLMRHSHPGQALRKLHETQ